MKVLVVYDTVSPMKITAKVAETIGEALKDKGIEVDSFFVKDVAQTTIKNYDCLIVGAPTIYFKASSGIMQFLNSLPDKDFSGQLAAAFDTQMQTRFSGNATKSIENKLKRLGFEIVAPPLIAYVEGETNQMQLKDGELEKTKNWAQEVAKAVLKSLI
jgi:flavorubredoxin